MRVVVDGRSTDPAEDIARVGTLLGGAEGTVLLATADPDAWVRATLGALDAGRALIPWNPAAALPPIPPPALALVDEACSPPHGARVWRIAPTQVRSTWARLLGRADAVATFPGCLAGLARTPPSAGGRLLTPLHPGPGFEEAGDLEEPVRELATRFGVEASSVLVAALPLHHPDAPWLGPLLARAAGCTWVYAPPEVGRVLDLLWRERATHLVCTPATLTGLARSDEAGLVATSDLRMVLCAGTPSETLLREAAVLQRPVFAAGRTHGEPPEEALEPGRDLGASVLRVAATVLKTPVERLHLGDGPDQVPGWDSVAHLELLVALEASFGVRLLARDFLRVRTLADAARLVGR